MSARRRSCTPGPRTVPTSRPSIAGVAALLIPLLVGCTSVFSDSEPIQPYEPPPARNPCEETFSAELMSNIGTAVAGAPVASQESVERTFDACSAEELVAANEYFVFSTGRQMGRLRAYRLPLDPGGMDDLTRMCQRDADLSTMRACVTSAPSGSR